jgi:hypothetical protein
MEPRPTTGAEGSLQSKRLGDPVSPFLASVGTTPNEAAADRLESVVVTDLRKCSGDRSPAECKKTVVLCR